MPGDVAEHGDGRDRKTADREWIAKRDPEELVEVGSRVRAAVIEVRVACDDPERGAIEAGVEQRMPDREEPAERTVLQVDVVPTIEEESEDEQRREQAGDEILTPDRLRAHPGLLHS